ncbi:hypothetical protein E2542_SST19585 [Spatholobus suberectus]|nr:hypothetical protein E2542_SST19585 [Spatholobus suberectus]
MDINSSSIDLQVTEFSLESKGKLIEKPSDTSSVGILESTVQEVRDTDSSKLLKEKKVVVRMDVVDNLDVKVSGVAGESEAEAIEKSSHTSAEVHVKCENCATEGLSCDKETAGKSPAICLPFDYVRGKEENVLRSSGYSVDKVPENLNERESEKNDDMAAQDHANQSIKQRNEYENDAIMVPVNRALCSGVIGLDAEYMEENIGIKEVSDQDAGQILHTDLPSFPSREMDQRSGHKGSKLAAMELDEAEECTSTTGDASSVSVVGVSDMDAKVQFDLNKGFNADDGKCSEMPGCTSVV